MGHIRKLLPQEVLALMKQEQTLIIFNSLPYLYCYLPDSSRLAKDLSPQPGAAALHRDFRFLVVFSLRCENQCHLWKGLLFQR